MTLADLNASDRDGFVAAIGWIFEHSPWVAERAWRRRPFGSLDELHVAMVAEVSAARRDEQLALLRAHPDLGSRAGMTEASSGEQAGAGLDRLAVDEFERLQQLNRLSREVRLSLPARGQGQLDARRADGARRPAAAPRPTTSLHEALRQVSRIAWFRLQDVVQAASEELSWNGSPAAGSAATTARAT